MRSNETLIARYTRNVASWLTRALSLVLTGVLAGTPAVAAVCELACSGGPRTAALSGMSHDQGQHEPGVAGPAADADVAGAPPTVGHEHHQEPAAASERLAGDLATLLAPSSQDCCTDIDQAAGSLRATRADTPVQPSPYIAIVGHAAHIDRVGPRSEAPRETHPPGRSSPASQSFVLRI